MAVDALLVDELQIETEIKSIPNHDEDLHFASHKVENVQNCICKQEWKAKHSAGKHMSLLSIIGTVICVAFLTFCYSTNQQHTVVSYYTLTTKPALPLQPPTSETEPRLPGSGSLQESGCASTNEKISV
jgi:hypothetical protein